MRLVVSSDFRAGSKKLDIFLERKSSSKVFRGNTAAIGLCGAVRVSVRGATAEIRREAATF